jgi:hypothetical protein
MDSFHAAFMLCLTSMLAQIRFVPVLAALHKNQLNYCDSMLCP